MNPRIRRRQRQAAEATRPRVLTRADVEAAVDSLFVNGCQEEGDRLVLMKEPKGGVTRDLGGWCRAAIVDRLCKSLGIPVTPGGRP